MNYSMLKAIDKELETEQNSEVVAHYNKLLSLKDCNDFKEFKILVFQPCAIGDFIVSSLSAELFQIKFPGCSIDYLVEKKLMKDVLQSNPFINNIHVNTDWNLFKVRDTLEVGKLLEQYDLGYSLYWWTPPMVKSFLEDLELPTDYTRVKLYSHNVNIDNLIQKDKLNIALQDEQDMALRWNTSNNKWNTLCSYLKTIGNVILVGTSTNYSYVESVEIIRKCDLFVGAHGSIEHAAAAVGCQCVTLSYIYDPKFVTVSSYQNKYRKPNRQHVCVTPKDWCGNYRCIDMNNSRKTLTHPPYGFRSETNKKYPPHKFMDCDYKGFKSCIHEIKVEEIIEKIEPVIADIKNDR